MARVGGHVGGCGCVTSRTGGGAGGSVVRFASGGVGCERGGARFATLNFASHPGTRRLHRFARAIILRMLFLKESEHVLCAFGGEDRERTLLALVGVFCRIHFRKCDEARDCNSTLAAADRESA